MRAPPIALGSFAPGACRDDEGLHQSTPDRGRKGLVTLVFFFPATDIDETGSQSRSIVTSQPESERVCCVENTVCATCRACTLCELPGNWHVHAVLERNT